MFVSGEDPGERRVGALWVGSFIHAAVFGWTHASSLKLTLSLVEGVKLLMVKQENNQIAQRPCSHWQQQSKGDKYYIIPRHACVCVCWGCSSLCVLCLCVAFSSADWGDARGLLDQWRSWRSGAPQKGQKVIRSNYRTADCADLIHTSILAAGIFILRRTIIYMLWEMLLGLGSFLSGMLQATTDWSAAPAPSSGQVVLLSNKTLGFGASDAHRSN